MSISNLTGIWSDPKHDGCGFFIVERGGVVGLSYFGHTLDGHLLWLTGAAPRASDGVDTTIELRKTSGLGFPSGDISRKVVGSAIISPPENPPEGSPDILTISLRVEMLQLAQVHMSPVPPSGHLMVADFQCTMVL